MKGNKETSEGMSACELLTKFHFLSAQEPLLKSMLATPTMHAINACQAGKVLAPTDEPFVKQSLSSKHITANTFAGTQYVTPSEYKHLANFSLLCNKKHTVSECDDEVRRLVFGYNNCPQSDT